MGHAPGLRGVSPSGIPGLSPTGFLGLSPRTTRTTALPGEQLSGARPWQLAMNIRMVQHVLLNGRSHNSPWEVHLSILHCRFIRGASDFPRNASVTLQTPLLHLCSEILERFSIKIVFTVSRGTILLAYPGCRTRGGRSSSPVVIFHVPQVMQFP